MKTVRPHVEEFTEYRKRHQEYLDAVFDMDFDKIEELGNEHYFQAPTVSDNDLMKAMITAIFEQSFELDVKKWNDDLALTYYIDDKDADRVDYFQASKRLMNPVDSYIKPKKSNNKKGAE